MSAQKSPSRSVLRPGQAEKSGRANHGASSSRVKSYSPNSPAATQPTRIAIGIAKNRRYPEARSIRSAAAASVAAPTAGPETGDAPAGTSFSLVTAMGMAEAAIIMKETPATTGVMTRRSCTSHAATANMTSDATTTRLDITARPPSFTASTQAANRGTPGPIMSM